MSLLSVFAVLTARHAVLEEPGWESKRKALREHLPPVLHSGASNTFSARRSVTGIVRYFVRTHKTDLRCAPLLPHNTAKHCDHSTARQVYDPRRYATRFLPATI